MGCCIQQATRQNGYLPDNGLLSEYNHRRGVSTIIQPSAIMHVCIYKSCIYALFKPFIQFFLCLVFHLVGVLPILQRWDCGINSGCTSIQARVLHRLLQRWTPPPMNIYRRVVVSVHLKTTFAMERPFSQFKVFLHCATGGTGL